jgi:alpha-N-arabinofuranosidase
MNTITIHASAGQHTISRHIYGHFAEHLGRCIYDGIWVGEDSPIPNVRGIRQDIVEALRHIRVPNLRWPGGCFADNYDWRDGIGAKDWRPVRLNMWGNVPENNHFGTHEFMDLCEQIGCEPYIAGNVGSGSVREMRDWLEYLSSNQDTSLANLRRANGRESAWTIPFWGIGNENWGCGGQMTPEYYADLYCQYQTFLRNYGEKKMLKIASGYGGSDTEAEDLVIFMEHITKRRFPVMPDGISIHYYVYLRYQEQHSATVFGEAEWFTVLKMARGIGEVIEKNIAVLDRYDPDNRIGLYVDEWGVWYPPEPDTHPEFLYQQNSMRDAVAAALTLHIFHDYCDRVHMANIAQVVNVLQAMILTQGEQMILTPTYHVFDMFKGHQDATRLPVEIECENYSYGSETLPAISASASQRDTGQILLTLCNLKPTEDITVDCRLKDFRCSKIEGVVLQADDMTAHNTFAQPDRVQPVNFDGVVIESNEQLRFYVPKGSVISVTLLA